MTLRGRVSCPSNVPAPTVTVAPLGAHDKAAETVRKGLVCDAETHAGSDVAALDTYRVVVAAPAAEAVAATAVAAVTVERAAVATTRRAIWAKRERFDMVASGV